MSIDAKISARLDELIELGKKVVATRRPPAPNHITSDFVDVQLANRWMTSCLSLLSRVFGAESDHYQRLNRQFADYPKWPNVQQAFGVLQAAKDDFHSESLFTVKRLVEADLFEEFLGQADHLLDAGYFAPAAVIAGCVLEDGLRKLCIANGITLPDNPKLANGSNSTRAMSKRCCVTCVTSWSSTTPDWRAVASQKVALACEELQFDRLQAVCSRSTASGNLRVGDTG
jgi:hypothetical protein